MHQINQLASIWLLDVIGYIWLYLVIFGYDCHSTKIGGTGHSEFQILGGDVPTSGNFARGQL